jgi:hypothetical protein
LTYFLKKKWHLTLFIVMSSPVSTKSTELPTTNLGNWLDECYTAMKRVKRMNGGRASHHPRSWKNFMNKIFLFYAVRSSINSYDLTVINSIVHQKSCLDFPQSLWFSWAVVISLRRFPHGNYPQRILIRWMYVGSSQSANHRRY